MPHRLAQWRPAYAVRNSARDEHLLNPSPRTQPKPGLQNRVFLVRQSSRIRVASKPAISPAWVYCADDEWIAVGSPLDRTVLGHPGEPVAVAGSKAVFDWRLMGPFHQVNAFVA